jgi:hypothetical protein
MFLRRGLLSFAVLLFVMLPSIEVNDGRDQADDKRQRECGPLQLDFTNPCNAIALTLGL